jgi:hypothetical protein
LETAQDLEEFLFPAFTHVADNLPEVSQYLDLVRDSCTALGVQMIPDNVVEHGIGTDPQHRFQAEDDRLMPKARLYKTESEYDVDKRKGKHEKNNTKSKRRKLGIDGELEAPTQDLSLPAVDELARKDDGLTDEEWMGPSTDLETGKDQS